MRAVIFLALALAVAGGGYWWWREQEQARAPLLVPTAAPKPPGAAAQSPPVVHDCRDQCDQSAVLEQWPDARLRACRAHCGGLPARPYEPIRSITVAPADHRAVAAPGDRAPGDRVAPKR